MISKEAFNDFMAVVISIFVLILFITLIYNIAVYVIFSFSHMKALKLAGYRSPGYAWIPYVNYFAFADAVCEGEYIYIFKFKIPTQYFRFWWVLFILLTFIPFAGIILAIITRIICMGTIYTKLYAKIEQTTEDKVQVLGYISGFLNIIAIVKFFTYKTPVKKVDLTK